MTDSANRILTTHAGSLPRDPTLRPMLAALAKGDVVDLGELADAVEKATVNVVAKQLGAGLDIVNDGEQGRESFFTYVQHRMTGFGGESARPIMADRIHFKDFAERSLRQAHAPERVNLMKAPRAEGPVAYTDRGRAEVKAECERFARVLESQPDYAAAFMTSASPGIIAAAMENVYFPDIDAYIDAVALALRDEYRQIVDAGFLLQIDAPDLAMERHTLFQDRPLEDFQLFVHTIVHAINRALQDIPRDRVRLHVC
jgi:5-methyltetrahydropteroyltriglutamate--homocysteine methyltransferase